MHAHALTDYLLSLHVVKVERPWSCFVRQWGTADRAGVDVLCTYKGCCPLHCSLPPPLCWPEHVNGVRTFDASCSDSLHVSFVVCVGVGVGVCVCLWLFACVRVCVCVGVGVCVYFCDCLRACVCLCLCLCVPAMLGRVYVCTGGDMCVIGI